MQSIENIREECEKFIASDSIPQHLKAANTGKLSYPYFEIVFNKVRDDYGGKYSQQNLKRALYLLIQSGRLPNGKPQIQNERGLWVAAHSASKAEELKHQSELASLGVVKTSKSHLERPEEKPTDDLKAVFNKIFHPQQTYNPPPTREPKLRHIPDDATEQDLKKYTPAEIRAFLKRKREQQWKFENDPNYVSE